MIANGVIQAVMSQHRASHMSIVLLEVCVISKFIVLMAAMKDVGLKSFGAYAKTIKRDHKKNPHLVTKASIPTHP